MPHPAYATCSPFAAASPDASMLQAVVTLRIACHVCKRAVQPVYEIVGAGPDPVPTCHPVCLGSGSSAGFRYSSPMPSKMIQFDDCQKMKLLAGPFQLPVVASHIYVPSAVAEPAPVTSICVRFGVIGISSATYFADPSRRLFLCDRLRYFACGMV